MGNPLVKKADDPPIARATYSPTDYPGATTNAIARNKVLGIGLTALGLGAAGRSLIGLRDMYAKAFSHRPAPTAPAVVEIGVPTVTEDDDEEQNRQNRMRAPTLFKSADKFNYNPSPSDPSNTANIGILPDVNPTDVTASPLKAMLNYLGGLKHVTPTTKPWFMTAALGAGMGGLYGGYKLVDHVLDKTHQADKDRELEDAKNEYRKALVEQYSPTSPAVKRANAEATLGEDLNTLYELTKEATRKGGWGDKFNDWSGTALSGYGALAALLAGGSGLAAYNWTKARSPEERLAKAIKQREKLRWSTRPPEIYAVTKPLPVRMSSQERPKDIFTEATPEDQEAVQKISSEKIAALYRP